MFFNKFNKGKIHPSTTHFDDSSLSFNSKPSEITIYHDDKLITGIIVTYVNLSTNQTSQSLLHSSSKNNPSSQKYYKYTFLPDEYIIEIVGKSGDAIDALGFTTNKGKKPIVGGSGGKSFRFESEPGFHFTYFKGGFGGYYGGIYLDYIETSPSPMPINIPNNNQMMKGNQKFVGVVFNPVQQQPMYTPPQQQQQQKLQGNAYYPPQQQQNYQMPIQGNAYPNQGNAYPNQGNAYPNQGNAYSNQGNAYPNQGNVYPNQGNFNPNLGYQNQGNDYPNQGNAYPNQGNFNPNLGNINQNQGNFNPNQANAYQNQGNAYPNQGNAYPNQGNSYPNQGNAYPNQGNEYPPLNPVQGNINPENFVKMGMGMQQQQQYPQNLNQQNPTNFNQQYPQNYNQQYPK